MNFLEPGPTRCFPGSVRRFLLVAVLVLGVAWVLPAAASAALTATQIRIGNHPAFVRVVVDFTGGTLQRNDVESPDPQPFDGRARVRVTRVGITTGAAAVTQEGVTARIVQRSGSIVLQLSARKHRFKYLEHGVLHSPERLVVDLWKSRPPTARRGVPGGSAGRLPQHRQLRLPSPGASGPNGSENDLFEHMFQVNVRNQKGRVVGTRPVTASGGHWHRTVQFDIGVAQKGTVEVGRLLRAGRLAHLHRPVAGDSRARSLTSDRRAAVARVEPFDEGGGRRRYGP